MYGKKLAGRSAPSRARRALAQVLEQYKSGVQALAIVRNFPPAQAFHDARQYFASLVLEQIHRCRIRRHIENTSQRPLKAERIRSIPSCQNFGGVLRDVHWHRSHDCCIAAFSRFFAKF
jgi:hypothetical protein